MGTTLQDDITKANARICKHMNDDHKISIIAYCDYYGGNADDCRNLCVARDYAPAYALAH